MSKVYIGDSVYAEYHHGSVKLTTEDGQRISNTIWLEEDVLKNFLIYIREKACKEVEKWTNIPNESRMD